MSIELNSIISETIESTGVDQLVYTVPEGQFLVVYSKLVSGNGSGTVQFKEQLAGGDEYSRTAFASVAQGGRDNIKERYEAGDSIYVNGDAGITVTLNGMLFDLNGVPGGQGGGSSSAPEPSSNSITLTGSNYPQLNGTYVYDSETERFVKDESYAIWIDTEGPAGGYWEISSLDGQGGAAVNYYYKVNTGGTGVALDDIGNIIGTMTWTDEFDPGMGSADLTIAYAGSDSSSSAAPEPSSSSSATPEPSSSSSEPLHPYVYMVTEAGDENARGGYWLYDDTGAYPVYHNDNGYILTFDFNGIENCWQIRTSEALGYEDRYVGPTDPSSPVGTWTSWGGAEPVPVVSLYGGDSSSSSAAPEPSSSSSSAAPSGAYADSYNVVDTYYESLGGTYTKVSGRTQNGAPVYYNSVEDTYLALCNYMNTYYAWAFTSSNPVAETTSNDIMFLGTTAYKDVQTGLGPDAYPAQAWYDGSEGTGIDPAQGEITVTAGGSESSSSDGGSSSSSEAQSSSSESASANFTVSGHATSSVNGVYAPYNTNGYGSTQTYKHASQNWYISRCYDDDGYIGWVIANQVMDTVPGPLGQDAVAYVSNSSETVPTGQWNGCSVAAGGDAPASAGSIVFNGRMEYWAMPGEYDEFTNCSFVPYEVGGVQQYKTVQGVQYPMYIWTGTFNSHYDDEDHTSSPTTFYLYAVEGYDEFSDDYWPFWVIHTDTNVTTGEDLYRVGFKFGSNFGPLETTTSGFSTTDEANWVNTSIVVSV